MPQFVVHVVEHPVHCELQPEQDVLASAEATELQPEHVLPQVDIHELDAQTPSQSFLHVAEHCVKQVVSHPLHPIVGAVAVPEHVVPHTTEHDVSQALHAGSLI